MVWVLSHVPPHATVLDGKEGKIIGTLDLGGGLLLLPPVASRSHWLTAVLIFSTRRPAAEPVSSDSATDFRATA